jgi:adenine-specific DNA-methyltransferase
MSLQSLIDNPKELLELITECLKPKDIEKKQFGEVFTPMKLVNEMLDKLPIEVWNNKELKWLDPCCGMGNFPIAVYLKLMETLKDEINDVKERKKHILENMLYMCELNKKNVLITKQIFDINNEYKLNIFEGDSLKVDYNKEFRIKQFDIIMGNPPYQKENKKNNSARGGTNNNLYLEFVNISIQLLKKNGYLLYIHPLNWRKIGSKIFSKFINRNIHYLKLNYGGDLFENVSVKTDYYVLKNSNDINYKSTIEYINNKENYISNVILSKTLKFIPNIFNECINSILEKISLYGKQYECIISSDCHKTRSHVNKNKTDKYKYPLFNTSGNPYEYFSSKEHKNQYSKKIILSNSGKLSPFYDDGKLGTTQDSMYILVVSKEEAELIINTINSELFIFLIQICQWGNFRNEASLFTYFKYPDINIINDLKIDDNFINKYYKLNKKEIDFLENIKINKKSSVKNINKVI